jgi:hypothetical protein
MDLIPIQRATNLEYENKEYKLSDAIEVLNSELDNGKTIWIDGQMFNDSCITEDVLLKCKKNVCVTNKLIGG